jgi:hypothetical protein
MGALIVYVSGSLRPEAKAPCTKPLRRYISSLNGCCRSYNASKTAS